MIRIVAITFLIFFDIFIGYGQVSDRSIKSLTEAEHLLFHDPVRAEKILTDMLDQPGNDSNPEQKAMAHRLLATLCAIHSRKKEEIEHLFKSYWYFKSTNHIGAVAEAERLIGDYYLRMNLPEQASGYFNNALSLAIASREMQTQIKIIEGLAMLALRSNQKSEALLLYQEAINLSEKAGYERGLLENWHGKSFVYQQMGEPQKMLACTKKALMYKTENADTLAILYGNLGMAYLQAGRLDSADFFLRKGLMLIMKGSNKIEGMKLMKAMSQLLEKQNRPVEAMQYLKLRDSLRTEVFTEQLKSEVSYAESIYKQSGAESKLAETIKHSRTLITALVSGVLVLVIMVIIIFWLRNRNRFIRKQKAQLDNALKVLMESENLLQQLFDNSPNFIITHTLDGEILSANSIVQDSFLLEAVEVKGKPVLDFLPGIDREKYAIFIHNLRETGSSNGWIQVQDRRGSMRVLRYQSKIINSDSHPYAITFALDDTEAYNARLETERERGRLLSVMENSPDIYAILRKDGTIKFMNRSNFFELEEVIDQNIVNVLPSGTGQLFYTNLQHVFETTSPLEFELNVRNRTFLTKLIPVASDARVEEVLTINTDITELRKRQQIEQDLNKKIENNERRFRNLVEGSMVLICSHDLEGFLITVNTPGAKTMGYEADELIGKRLDEFIADDFRKDFQSYLDQIIVNGFYEGFLTICRKDGEKRIFLCRNVLLKEEKIVLGSAQDVTEWKKAEHREKQIKKELQQAKENAEESNRLKTIFLGSLSHEVRTPLQGILGFAEILENPRLPEAKRIEYLEIVKRRARDMQNVIEALLDMASVESGEIKAFPVFFNLYEFAEDFFLKLKQDYPVQKQVQFIMKNKLSKEAAAFIDLQHLNQVIINLVRNAIKFTEAGSVTLSFVKSHDHFTVLVSDTGIGISEDKLDQIFKPFRQAHEGISRSKGGIGLGLAISKKLVELWGGTIAVESTPGKGSIFSLTIPRADT